MANKDEIHDHIKWEVNVIASNEMNAFVLPVSLHGGGGWRETDVLL